jgi:8-oxo-dGTP pyrophosphatase MutT (NUDIX family)
MPQQDILFYVSMKGVILQHNKVLLLRKHSGEWDLPGGRLGEEESPKQCLIREVGEETGLTVKPGRFLHRWIRRRPGKTDVFLVSHFCKLSGPETDLALTHEHSELDWFSPAALDLLALSQGVRKSVRRAYHIRKTLTYPQPG